MPAPKKKETYSQAMERLEKDWEVYPILHLDLNARHYNDTAALTSILNEFLEKWEALYGTEKQDRALEERFSYVIEQAPPDRASRGDID